MTSGEPQPVFLQVLTQADKAPDKTALVSDGRTISYAELATKIRSTAATLAAKFDINPGDRVVLLADTNPDFVCAYWAVHSIGAICVPLDPHIAAQRFSDIVERVSPRIVVSESAISTNSDKQIRFDELADAAHRYPAVELTDVAVSKTADILFTTGTTGRSKGVILSHRALAVASAHIIAFIGMRANAIEVLALPLSHSFGLGRVRCVLSVGATLFLTPGFINAGSIVTALSSIRATALASVPTGIAILLGNEASALGRFAHQLEYIEIGSSSMPLEHKHRLMNLLPNTRICMHYGLTEASRSAYLSFHDDKDKLESIGLPSPGVEMRIVDESGQKVNNGVDGHIEIRGGHLMTGYWQDADLTEKSVHDDWLQTGDLGWCDADGYYYLKARTSEIINVGGRKVSPHEIEDILTGHPAVAECACVGVPDPQKISGEIISVFLVANPAYDDLPKFSELAKLLRQTLEAHKVPRRFTWIEEIPKSSSGKILRRQLRNPV